MPRGVAPQGMKMGRAPRCGTERGIYAASMDYLDLWETLAAQGERRTAQRHKCRAPALSVFIRVAQHHFVVSRALKVATVKGWL